MTMMRNLVPLALAFTICLCAACSSKGNTDSTSDQDTTHAPGVGAAPDNSREVPDSTLHKPDTTTVNKQ